MLDRKNFEEWLNGYAGKFAAVVPFAPGDKLLRMDFTAANTSLTDDVLKDTNLFIQYINQTLGKAGAKYGVGGYGEDRIIYRRSSVFDGQGPNPTFPNGEGVSTQPLLSNDTTQTVADADVSVGEFYWQADAVTYKLLKNFVSQHRRNATPAEDLLWQHLRGNKLDGYSFRRQHVIGNFIADFVCLAKKLVIEIDGLQHQLLENQLDDAARTVWLNSKGFKVMRFTNSNVLHNAPHVLTQIKQKLLHLPFAERKKYQKEAESSQSGQQSDVRRSFPVGEGWDGALTQPRSVHLGLDIWGAPYTRIMAPLNGIVHSFAFNNAFGDYGATIILTHNLDGETFHTLYGHLSLNSIKNLHEGDAVRKGDVIAEFGIPFENGQWPPHLHFQLIRDMQGAKGDYPGVCSPSDQEFYLNNCPDANIIARMIQQADSA